MNVDEKDQIRKKLPGEYHDLFDVFDKQEAKKLPSHSAYDHQIVLEQPTTVLGHSPLYGMSPERLRVCKEFLEENLAKGYIKASSAPYAAPVLFAQKPGGGLRFCVDYRRLNPITKKDRYPIPLIQETLAQLTGAKHLTKLDVIAAFNKLRIAEGQEDLTTFKCRFGSYK